MALLRIRVAWRLLLAAATGVGVVFVLVGVLRSELSLRVTGQALLLSAVLLVLSYCNQYRERLRALDARLVALQGNASTDDGETTD